MTLSRDIFGRTVQVAVLWRVFHDDYTVREFLPVLKRRGRGYWPSLGRPFQTQRGPEDPFPIFRYWMLGPVELRVWTREAMALREEWPL